MRHGAHPDQDLKQLWQLFFIFAFQMSKITLRNHGFILQPNGWILSPAFDINPVPDSTV